MRVISDLHIHGRHSQATSKDISIPNLEKYAKIKGINLLGTGDFTHPGWIQHLKEELPAEKEGIYYTKNGFPFIFQTEISLIYSQDGKGRRIHNVVLAPNIDVVRQITDYLLTKGRIDYDGRPIFKIPCPEFVESLRSISKDIEVIPAHCLLPEGLVHTQDSVKPINSVHEGEKVITHKGRAKTVKKIYKREYSGNILKIIPACLKENTRITTEHPIYAIKSFKDCKNMSHTICKPACAYLKRGCKNKRFLDYQPEWIQAKDLKKGDIVLFPRPKEIIDKKFIHLDKEIKGFFLDNKLIKPKKGKINKKNIGINNIINISGSFCRLAGYYLAKGYISRDKISFTFNKEEKKYIEDVKLLMNKVFGENIQSSEEKEESKGRTISFYSKILKEFFKMFYGKNIFRAQNKKMPSWFMNLPIAKQKEIIIGWWRGDAGYTTSKELANQIKIIMIRMGIIPSIYVTLAKDVNQRRKYKNCLIKEREITAKNDCYHLHNLSFFKENLDLLDTKEFSKFKTRLDRRKCWIDDNYVYLPITRIEEESYKGEVYNLEVEEDNSYLTESMAVHNCWTPWFSLFGSKSGFDTVEQCFKDQTKYINALETGLSSDPAMNWRLSQLDDYQLVSFSDLHSFWPWRIGREATVFDFKKLSYKNVLEAVRTGKGLSMTIEVDPNYGKYHADGHRNCNVWMTPKQSKAHNYICPKCGKELTIGVWDRIEELADRPEGFKPEGAVPFKSLIPLSEIISKIIGKAVATKSVWAEYHNLVTATRSELNVLLDTNFEELKNLTTERIAKAIIANREGKIAVKPGYDGVYGEPLFEGEKVKEMTFDNPVKPKVEQKNLGDF